MDKTDRDLRDLRHRVDRLEHLAVQALCAAAGLALLVGLVLDLAPVQEDSDEDDVLPRLLTAGFHAIGYRTDSGDPDGFSVAVGIGFLGLLVVTVVVLWSLLVVATGGGSELTARVLRVAVTLLLVGTVIAALVVLLLLGDDDVEAGWGIVVFALGGLLSLGLLRSEVRALWDPVLRS